MASPELADCEHRDLPFRAVRPLRDHQHVGVRIRGLFRRQGRFCRRGLPTGAPTAHCCLSSGKQYIDPETKSRTIIRPLI
eukprot:1880505-Alexandrium_andersonii.AAC.1